MSWFTFHTHTKELLPVLTRIADALDRLIPVLPEADDNLKPEEAVTYVDEEVMARQEEIEELSVDARRIEEYLAEHPEEAEDVQF